LKRTQFEERGGSFDYMQLDGVAANWIWGQIRYARSVVVNDGSVARSATIAEGLARYLYLYSIARDGKEIRAATYALLAAQCDVFMSEG
jgi:hypothetical protein